jgi:imidazolonepropionase-like amidohydrolase
MRLYIGALFFQAVPIIAQTDYDIVPDVTSTILINNVHIQVSPEVNMGIGDILIEDGVIKLVAPEIDAPYNAKIIEADSAYAYACFIDALSHTGIPKPEGREERPKVKFTGFPPNDVAGISPELEASTLIKVDDASVKALREAGFAISHVVPMGRMLPGQGCLISLQADTEQEMILKDHCSMFFQFSGARGFYPSTVIGVMAKWRDLYRNALYLNKNMKTYDSGPSGNSRPRSDKSLEALIPVTQNSMPVFMATNNAKDVFRAIELQKELGYTLVLSDVKEASAAMKHFKSPNINILLSASLPKSDEKEEKSKKKSRKSDDQDDEKEETEPTKRSEKKDKKEVTDPQTEALKKRKQESYESYVSQASNLEKADIPFAFSMLSAKPGDLKSNLEKMIKAGLSESWALAALTVNPAKLLGIENIAGTIDKGKLANIFISDKPYFEEKSKIKYVFVEGQMTEIKSKSKKPSKGRDGDFLSGLYGIWSYTVTVFEEDQTGQIEISDDSGSLKITLTVDSNPDDTDTATDVNVNDQTVAFSIVVGTPDGQELPVSLELNFEGEAFSGTATIEAMGSFPIEGTKVSSPD